MSNKVSICAKQLEIGYMPLFLTTCKTESSFDFAGVFRQFCFCLMHLLRGKYEDRCFPFSCQWISLGTAHLLSTLSKTLRENDLFLVWTNEKQNQSVEQNALIRLTNQLAAIVLRANFNELVIEINGLCSFCHCAMKENHWGVSLAGGDWSPYWRSDKWTSEIVFVRTPNQTQLIFAFSMKNNEKIVFISSENRFETKIRKSN